MLLLIRAALLLGTCVTLADAAASTLKISSCDSSWPFVGVGANSQLTGFDVQFWGLVYAEMKSVAQSTSDATALAMLGDKAPDIQVTSKDAVLKGVQDGSVDVGLCGFQIDPAQHASMDYSSTVFFSGYRAIVAAAEPELSGIEVLKGAMKGFNESAVFAILMLLILSVVNAHLVWLLERHDNVQISKEYGWGVFDSWWLSLVTALTVGYGDKVPVTFLGRLIIVIWMFIGTYCVGMFGAAVTSDFLTDSDPAGTLSLLGMKSIADLDRAITVGTADAFARQYVADAVPGIKVTQFSDTSTLLAALAEGIIQVAVDERWRARWLIENDEKFKTQNMIPVGDVFGSKAHALAISRPVQAAGGRGTNPILHTLNQAVTNLVFGSGRAKFESVYNSWMLQYEPRITTSYAVAVDKALYKWNVIYGIGLLGFISVWGACVYIHYRKEIKEARIRDSLLAAMGLHHKFSQQELRDAAHKFFEEIDTDHSGTVDADELITRLETMGMTVTEKDLEAIFEASSGTEWTLSESIADMKSSGSFRNKAKGRNLDQKQFQAVMLKLTLAANKEENSELTAPVLQVHLEQAMLEMKEHFHYIEKKVNRILEEQKEMNGPQALQWRLNQIKRARDIDADQDALRTPSPATFLPANLSTIAKPQTPENRGRQEYSPLARTNLDANMDLDDRGYTSKALVRPPGHAGNPGNSVQTDAVLPSRPITRHRSFLDTQRADFKEHDARVRALAIQDREAYSPGNRARFNARHATPDVHSGRDLPPRPYSSDMGHQHATNSRYGSRSNSFSENPGQGPGSNGHESGDKIPAEVRETWSAQQEMHSMYAPANHDLLDEHPFAPSPHTAQWEMFHRRQAMPRYHPPSEYKRQRARSGATLRPYTAQAERPSYRTAQNAERRHSPTSDQDSITARSGTVTVVQNQVLSEHVVEVHGQNQPASRKTYHGPNHAWDSAERERMGGESADTNGTVGWRDGIPLMGADSHRVASGREDSGSGAHERNAVSEGGETSASGLGDGGASGPGIRSWSEHAAQGDGQA